MADAAKQAGGRGRSEVRACWMFLLAATLGCGRAGPPAATSSQPVVLRIGVGNVASGNPQAGLRQVANNQSFEGLVRFGPDGRPRPWLAKSWQISSDRLSMTLDLRPEAKFHDGSPADAHTIAEALQTTLPTFMGPVFEDIKGVESSGDGRQIIITFKRPSPFLLETLEATIRKPGAQTVGTGPFMSAGATSANEMRSNPDYYLGRPIIDRIVVTSYPTMRSAWADMLRNNIDMLYEVGAEAAPSMRDATTISTFAFTRPYQYMVLINGRLPKFRPPAVRRALNSAIDRAEVVREGFDGQAIAADGLVWPQNWAFNPTVPRVKFDPESAAKIFKSGPALTFTCLVPTDYERVALVVQRQLAAVGVTMKVEATTPDKAFQALRTPTYEAVLADPVGGPSLWRTYQPWHSGSESLGMVGSPRLDSALDTVRAAASDDDYRAAVEKLQRLTFDDPPAIYLAWGQRSRAISKRFDVPVEPGRDILSTLRLWKPAAGAQTASRN
jgi:peptide/nickel transport system substrate-binding protein